MDNELINCNCGCGQTRLKYDERGREYRYIRGHIKPWLGKKMSDETKRKMGESRRGERNPAWKGDKVGIKTLHQWIRENWKMPKVCMLCEKVPPTDLANITGIYDRELKNWAYLCHKCHLGFDNIIERNLLRFNRIRHEKYENSIQSENLVCIRCKRSHDELIKKLKKVLWSKKKEGWLCNSCSASLITSARIKKST